MGVAKRNRRWRRPWYRDFGIQPPFPWALIALYAVPILIVLGGVTVGMLLR